MIVQQYKDMLQAKSVIRQLSEFATARGAEIGYENVFDYSLGNPSVPVPQKFTQVMIDLLQNHDPMELHGYSQSLGIPAVRKAVAESLNKRFSMNYTQNHIFMTTGAAGAIAHAIRCVTQPGDEILTFAPFFPEYQPYINLSGAHLQVVPANTEDFQINFDLFEKMCTDKVMAVLINTPNNPSGIVYTTETIRRLAEIMKAKEKEYGHDIFLISDEPYREIVFEGVDAPYPSAFYDNSLSCYSFSKSLSLPGERIGYVAVNPNCTDAEYITNMCAQISRGTGHNCPPSIIQLAVAQVLELTSDLSVYEKNMNILYKELTALGLECVKPGGTFYMFPKALEEDAVAFCKKAQKYDLILVPSDTFGVPGYFRIAYCIDTKKVERSLEAFQKFIHTEY
ncbi:MAG: pyridoxal phosphate-dependent aminotransferase [Roseburia sp.]|nr:pyridoxal phosphate-dependent aminotransferase [Ruminococcus sp.]MCM1153724.1 pyridoxal phosphate-dependent aminotransferase [Roseburia sp.]MCM1242199.1 pyridoxal phosphate-dependent aminotransferase [Roseburia sp.]